MSLTSATPIYKQLAETIRARILSGELKSGDQLLSEAELCALYKVSRVTVRNAISILVEEGLLVREHGRGTFIKEYTKVNRNFLEHKDLIGFTQTCHQNGRVPSSQVLDISKKTASLVESVCFGLQPSAKVISIKRLRLCDGVPVIIEETHFPVEFSFLLEEDLTGSLYAILNSHKISLGNAVKTIDIGYANVKDAEFLRIPTSRALILLQDIVYDESGKCICAGTQLINSEKYKIIF